MALHAVSTRKGGLVYRWLVSPLRSFPMVSRSTNEGDYLRVPFERVSINWKCCLFLPHDGWYWYHNANVERFFCWYWGWSSSRKGNYLSVPFECCLSAFSFFLLSFFFLFSSFVLRVGLVTLVGKKLYSTETETEGTRRPVKWTRLSPLSWLSLHIPASLREYGV